MIYSPLFLDQNNWLSLSPDYGAKAVFSNINTYSWRYLKFHFVWSVIDTACNLQVKSWLCYADNIEQYRRITDTYHFFMTCL
jgi:hypothetical protein